MVLLRLTVPNDLVESTLEVLASDPYICHLVRVQNVGVLSQADLITCEVPREHASVVLKKLQGIGLDVQGGIATEEISASIDQTSANAARVASGASSDGVVWENVISEIDDVSEFSVSYLILMALASIIAAVGILLENPILIVGAMVVGPEFGPIAAMSVGLVLGIKRHVVSSLKALLIGLPLASLAALVLTVLGREFSIYPDTFIAAEHPLAKSIATVDVNTIIVAAAAGIAGILSLTTKKSSALVGVLVSVTTIPAAAEIGISIAYSDGSGAAGSALQLVANIATIVLVGAVSIGIQRYFYHRRLSGN